MAESSGSRQKCIRSSADTLLPRDYETERMQIKVEKFEGEKKISVWKFVYNNGCHSRFFTF